MATASVENTVSTAGPANELAKKKKRLNPARRKSAKAKVEAEVSVSQKVPAAATISPPVPAKQPGTAIAKTAQNNQLRTQPSKPAVLQRQNTEPVTDFRRPALQRTTTTPETASNKSRALGFTAPALVTGGLVGCAAGAAILLGVGIWYDFSGAETAILTAKAAKICVDNLTEELITSLKAGTYSGDEALDMLRRTTLAYASTIPEGAHFVERIFREIDMVRKQRGREIDKVVAETYTELAKAGVSGATSAEMRTIVVGQLMKLTKFASKATQDIVARNPKLRPYREEAAKGLQGPRKTSTPTVRVNMAVRQKQAV